LRELFEKYKGGRFLGGHSVQLYHVTRQHKH